jgi:hypothetical protein
MDLKSELNSQRQAFENLTKSVTRLLNKKEDDSNAEIEKSKPTTGKKVNWRIQAFGLLLLFASWFAENKLQNNYQDKLNTISYLRIGTLNLELKEAINQVTISKYISQPPYTLNDSMIFKNSLVLFCGASLSIQSNAIEMFYKADRRSTKAYNAERVRIGKEKGKLDVINDVHNILALYNYYSLLQTVYLEKRQADIQEVSDLTQEYYEKIDNASDIFYWLYMAGSILLAYYYLVEKGIRFRIIRKWPFLIIKNI